MQNTGVKEFKDVIRSYSEVGQLRKNNLGMVLVYLEYVKKLKIIVSRKVVVSCQMWKIRGIGILGFLILQKGESFRFLVFNKFSDILMQKEKRQQINILFFKILRVRRQFNG